MYFRDELREILHRGDSCSEGRTASSKALGGNRSGLVQGLRSEFVGLSVRARVLGDQGVRAGSQSGLVGCGRP